MPAADDTSVRSRPMMAAAFLRGTAASQFYGSSPPMPAASENRE
jgi:hypothetical protein